MDSFTESIKFEKATEVYNYNHYIPYTDFHFSDQKFEYFLLLQIYLFTFPSLQISISLIES